jgi:hypothetical protein
MNPDKKVNYMTCKNGEFVVSQINFSELYKLEIQDKWLSFYDFTNKIKNIEKLKI